MECEHKEWIYPTDGSESWCAKCDMRRTVYLELSHAALQERVSQYERVLYTIAITPPEWTAKPCVDLAAAALDALANIPDPAAYVARCARLEEALRAIIALPRDFTSPEVFDRATRDIAREALK
jgi:hypothetical protein